MAIEGANRRVVLAGGLSLGIVGAASAAPPPAPPVRRDLYNGETDPAAMEWKGRREDIPARIRLARAGEPGEVMSISGIVWSATSDRPAADVLVYAYHTDATGLYSGGSNETIWSRRHGSRRGWVRTDANGRYNLDSIKPAPYPDRSMPAHIHLTVVEPGKPPYWIDDIVFDGEFRVDNAYRAKAGNRGGNGIIPLKRISGVWTGARDIRLERHLA